MRVLIIVILVGVSLMAASQDQVSLQKGEKAIDFTLKTVGGEKVNLFDLNKENPVVLVVLRGWPEYQCPACSRQVGQYLANNESFKKLNAKLILVYPGPSAVLQEKAKEFAEDFNFPDNFYFVIDPNYEMINKYGLRWDAPKETAYPSTFVINKNGIIEYSKVSLTHGGRASVEELLGALKEL